MEARLRTSSLLLEAAEECVDVLQAQEADLQHGGASFRSAGKAQLLGCSCRLRLCERAAERASAVAHLFLIRRRWRKREEEQQLLARSVILLQRLATAR